MSYHVHNLVPGDVVSGYRSTLDAYGSDPPVDGDVYAKWKVTAPIEEVGNDLYRVRAVRVDDAGDVIDGEFCGSTSLCVVEYGPEVEDLAALWERYGCRDFPVERLTDPAMRFAILSPADQTIVYATTDDPADGDTVDHGKARLWESAADALQICEWAHARDGLTSADDPWYMVEPVEDVAEFRARPPTW